jgi:hypothetical protein
MRVWFDQNGESSRRPGGRINRGITLLFGIMN